MKKSTLLSQTSTVLLGGFCNVMAYAQKNKPSWIKDVSPDDLAKAGERGYDWLLAIIALAILVGVGSAVWLFMFGESEQGKKMAINVIIGAVVFTVLPGIAWGFLTLI